MNAAHIKALTGSNSRSLSPVIPIIGMAKRLLCLGIFEVRRDSPGESCKMINTGSNQAHDGRIHNVHAQKSLKRPTSGYFAQNGSVFFIAGLATATKPSRPATHKRIVQPQRETSITHCSTVNMGRHP